MRKGIGNALRNLRDVNVAANALLQGRFALNSTPGLVGTIDVATRSGLKSTPADFGQTLARWGVPSGPFVMLPVIGPSTLRDGAGLAVDAAALSVPSHIPSDDVRRAIWGTAIIHARGQLVPLDDLITGDRYIFLRDAYLQRRAPLLRNDARSGEATGVSIEVFGDFDDELAGEFEDDL